MNRRRGYSLLELLLVLVIASILMSVALPAYRQVAIRAHRVVGKAALMEVLARQERYLLNHKRYSTSLAALGLEDDYYIGPTSTSVDGGEAVYKIELALLEGEFSGARAVPVNGQRGDRQCGTYTLDSRGLRGVIGSYAGQPGLCW